MDLHNIALEAVAGNDLSQCPKNHQPADNGGSFGASAPWQKSRIDLSSGDVSFGDFALPAMELGGLSAEIEYDLLLAEDSLRPGGSLVISLINGLSLTINHFLTHFEASTITDSLTSITLPELGSGLYWDTVDLSSLGVITVVPESKTLCLRGWGPLSLCPLRRSAQTI